MPQVIPFNGLLYNRTKVAGDDVIAPPYDVISPRQKDALYTKSPYNIVRIDFGKDLPGDHEGTNRYSRACDLLRQWMDEGILLRDDAPAFYAYEIEYEVYGTKKTLRGIFSLVEIVELGKGVYPHEHTRPKAKADRLAIMRHCMANLSPIFSIYNSPARTTSALIEKLTDPCLTVHDADGAVHKLYRIEEPSLLAAMSSELSGRPLFIADGHHRYEVALEFKHEMDRATSRTGTEKKPWDYVLMFLANTDDEGLTILPTHRMVKGISGKDEVLKKLASDFRIAAIAPGADVRAAVMKGGRDTFGLYLGSQRMWYTLSYKGGKLSDVAPALRDLDVVVLHELILRRDLGITEVAYEMRVETAVRRVHDGEFDAVFFLNPTEVTDLERVVGAGLRMPAKSTYFYPKLLTGMVVYKF